MLVAFLFVFMFDVNFLFQFFFFPPLQQYSSHHVVIESNS
jgi:hypothetical protein